ncbi:MULTISPECIES: M16 family metallopeptidase [Sphingobacterium]|uniref:M16 family metallopeptidase n=1 Tax=Sphingobacterium TaxID=28453 RepID=UPI00104AB823|nr:MULTISPECIES: M16 family metallopeptidase [Sphingobacterium]MCW2263149.1 putative Zn-dependent peptidase [Sphingobacterium kitahiroshimense]TCR11868.1 putative Zn-dependent peptidase [Sphingobacterium sp. JUb78]
MNRVLKTVGYVYLLFITSSSFAQSTKFQWKETTDGGYAYRYVTNDPVQTRFYKLKNGLTVILSPNAKQPRIQAYIATKAGSKTDPKEHTGLAHYLEHMLFKGTDKFGSLDWSKEKPLLDQVDNLYEKYNHSKDEAERTAIYKEIDRVSGEAAKYAIPNEYDKLMSSMGSKGTNAFTSFEQTVYVEDIPNNVIDKYLAVQAERFRNPILRLFHTELESVYEEKNISLDNDNRKSIEAIFAAMFPNNNYGKQTVLGSVEHLKNPSLKAIREYYNTYYVPNNMGIIMSGDFNPTDVIMRIDNAFSAMKSKPVPAYTFENEQPITSPISKTILGPSSEYLLMGFRFPGAANPDAQILNLMANVLTNGSAGLIDLDLVKSQKLLGAGAFPYVLKDYSMLILQGNPGAGQNLEDVKKLLLLELDKLRKGEFSEELLTSIVNNEKKSQIKLFESYNSIAEQLMSSFTSELDWAKELAYTDRLSTITKDDIVRFANKYLSDINYVTILKQKGQDAAIEKVVKPAITPITVNRNVESAFLKQINAMPEQDIKAKWLDYNTDLSKSKLQDLEVLAVQNKENELFSLTYQFDFGRWDNKLLGLAVGYLEFLGTKDKTSEEFSQAFYKLASDFTAGSGNEESKISIAGLNSNFKESVGLLHDLLHHCTVNEEAFKAYIGRLKKSRANAKENKAAIMEGLKSYAKYGAKNPFNYTYTDEELDGLKAADLVSLLHNLAKAKHTILYYGPLAVNDLVKNLKPLKSNDVSYFTIEKGLKFEEKPTDKNQVLFAQYPMKQAEVFWFRNAGLFDKNQMPTVSFFNGYFGGGMGSIVFQTLRESKALAYTTYAYYGQPQKKQNHSMVGAYIGTQTDKFKDAVVGMNELLNELPESTVGLESVRTNLMKSMASERITGSAILSSYLGAQRLGLSEDSRKVIYEKIPELTYNDLKVFHANNMSHKPYIYCILGDEKDLKEEDMIGLGNISKINLKEIFGY